LKLDAVEVSVMAVEIAPHGGRGLKLVALYEETSHHWLLFLRGRELKELAQ